MSELSASDAISLLLRSRLDISVGGNALPIAGWEAAPLDDEGLVAIVVKVNVDDLRKAIRPPLSADVYLGDLRRGDIVALRQQSGLPDCGTAVLLDIVVPDQTNTAARFLVRLSSDCRDWINGGQGYLGRDGEEIAVPLSWVHRTATPRANYRVGGSHVASRAG